MQRPDLTTATTISRELLAAGWKYDNRTDFAAGTVEREMLHPSGRAITARTIADGSQTTLTMTGLSLEQVAGAIRGAGLTGSAQTEEPSAAAPGRVGNTRFHIGTDGLVSMDAPAPDPIDYWIRLAADLHRAADQLATLAGTDHRFDVARITLHEYGKNVAAVDAVAEVFGTKATTERGGGRMPKYEVDAKVGDVSVWAYTYVDPPKNNRIAELERQLAEANAKLAAATRPAMDTTTTA